MAAYKTGWDTRYEWRAIALLSGGFGLVGLDRFIILPLFPSMMRDLHLDYQDLGLIASVFSLAWGASALLTGRLSDKIGRRRTLIPAVIVFSLLAGGSGLATSLVGLLFIRVLMGASEGAYTPASIAAAVEASKPSRRGFNLGIQQDLYAILGLGLGPILATQLLSALPSWRWVFPIVSVPGFLLAYGMHRVLRDTQGTLETADGARADQGQGGWREVFAHRNVPLNMLGMCFMLSCLLIVTTMAPNYLTDVLHLDLAHMGFVLSSMGLGGFIGQLVLPGLSDRIGRKTVVLLCYAATFASILVLLTLGPQPWLLFATLFAVSFFTNSMICLNVGPLTSEAVPAALTATATGLVVGMGELLGGGFAPGFAGYIAQHFGLRYTFEVALIGLALGFLAACFLRETVKRTEKAAATANAMTAPSQ
jgi:MFS family permease